MKQLTRYVICTLLGFASASVYCESALPLPETTETESNVLKLSHPYLPGATLPMPGVTAIKPKTLSLQDAIFLALRNNPEVKGSELQRVVDKYQLMLAKQFFRPQFKLDFTSTFGQTLTPTHTLSSGVSVQMPEGSEVGLGYVNNLNGGSGATTLTWKQPLLRGLGSVARIPLDDALTNEKVAKLSFKNNVMGVVVSVISAYRDLVKNYNNLAIQKRFLHESEITLKQYEMKVKVGKMAPSDLYQQKANFENTKLSFVQQENALQQNYQKFLSALGLVPSAKLGIVKTIDVKEYPLPSEEEAIKKALKGNIAYRKALLQLENTRRAIVVARNGRRWRLDVIGQATIGSADKPLDTISVPVAGPSATVNLEVPIDDMQSKANEVNARVQLEQVKLNLEQQKEDLVRQVMTQLQTIKSDWAQIQVSRTAVQLQKETLRAARLKLNYGRATVFEVNQDQDALLQRETSLVSTELSYLNDITGMQTIWGEALDVWKIELRY